MTPVSGTNMEAARSLAAAGKTREAQKAREPQDPSKEDGKLSPKPRRDEYLPEEKQEPIGRYWLGKDEEGQPKVFMDDPQKARPASPAGAPEKDEPGKKTEICICDTDKVDREVEKLKKKQEELKQAVATETDPARAQEQQKKLGRIEHELGQKDNDAYRRQHASYT